MKIRYIICISILLLESCSFMKQNLKHRTKIINEKEILLSYIADMPKTVSLSELNLDSISLNKLTNNIDTGNYYYIKLTLNNISVYIAPEYSELYRNLYMCSRIEQPSADEIKYYYQNICYITKQESDIKKIMKWYQNNRLVINTLSGLGVYRDSSSYIHFVDELVLFRNQKQLKRFDKYE